MHDALSITWTYKRIHSSATRCGGQPVWPKYEGRLTARHNAKSRSNLNIWWPDTKYALPGKKCLPIVNPWGHCPRIFVLLYLDQITIDIARQKSCNPLVETLSILRPNRLIVDIDIKYQASPRKFQPLLFSDSARELMSRRNYRPECTID